MKSPADRVAVEGWQMLLWGGVSVTGALLFLRMFTCGVALEERRLNRAERRHRKLARPVSPDADVARPATPADAGKRISKAKK